MAERLWGIGFLPGNIEKDLATKVSGLVYLYRNFNNEYQYVSLCSYKDEFVEAVFHVYDKTFNPRDKLQTPLAGTLYRNLPDLLDAVGKLYKPKK